jgi:hypothetical protein
LFRPFLKTPHGGGGNRTTRFVFPCMKIIMHLNDFFFFLKIMGNEKEVEKFHSVWNVRQDILNKMIPVVLPLDGFADLDKGIPTDEYHFWTALELPQGSCFFLYILFIFILSLFLILLSFFFSFFNFFFPLLFLHYITPLLFRFSQYIILTCLLIYLLIYALQNILVYNELTSEK